MTLPPTLRVAFLGSGSSGNATAVTDGRTTLLIDCGVSARDVARRLSSIGISPESVSGVLVTHEHADHVRGVRVFVARVGATVYATAGTRWAARLDAIAPDVRTLPAMRATTIGTLEVMAFRTSHDADDPVGFRIAGAGRTFGLMTDTGEMTPDAEESLRGCDLLGIESNHDEEMLASGPYPQFLKRRVSSSRGHLSNAQAADALERLASGRLSQVFALHLSRTNNRSELATSALEERLRALGHPARVTAATHDRACESSPGQPSLFEEHAG